MYKTILIALVGMMCFQAELISAVEAPNKQSPNELTNALFKASAASIPRCNQPERSNELVYPRAKESSEVIRVLTYNIRYEFAIDREQGNAWDIRKNKIQYLLQYYQPDIICLQEVCISYIADIHALLPEYTCIAFDVSNKNKDVALLIRKKRFSIEDQQYFWLSEEPLNKNIPHYPSWGAKSPRIVVYATLRDLRTEKKLIALCTHFDSTSMESRMHSASVMMQQIAQMQASMPLILAGDFNFMMSSPLNIKKSNEAYSIITHNSGLYDIRNVSENKHYGPDGTWIGWPYDIYAAPSGTVGERLDHLFTRHCTVVMEGILNLKVNDNVRNIITPSHNEFKGISYPSDHLPVIADILVQ